MIYVSKKKESLPPIRGSTGWLVGEEPGKTSRRGSVRELRWLELESVKARVTPPIAR